MREQGARVAHYSPVTRLSRVVPESGSSRLLRVFDWTDLQRGLWQHCAYPGVSTVTRLECEPAKLTKRMNSDARIQVIRLYSWASRTNSTAKSPTQKRRKSFTISPDELTKLERSGTQDHAITLFDDSSSGVGVQRTTVGDCGSGDVIHVTVQTAGTS